MKLLPGFGAGIGFGLVMLGLVNAILFSDQLVQRYGSVFAVGRAMDKQLFAEKTCPQVLLIGNSRVDNAVDPRALQAQWQTSSVVFNHGIPGANARIGYGMLARLEQAGCLANGQLRLVILGLDESYLQDDDSLGYSTFFADRAALLDEGALTDWVGTWLKLWAYTDNLRQLREPEKALRFVKATFEPLEPVGGAAWRFLGYRAGFGASNQNETQALQQETKSDHPPSISQLAYLFKIGAMLKHQNIPMAVVFPPLLNRNTAYVDPARANGAYLAVSSHLRAAGIHVIVQPDPVPRESAFFVNVGHLNDSGAQIFSRWLATVLASEWSWLEGEGRPQ